MGDIADTLATLSVAEGDEPPHAADAGLRRITESIQSGTGLYDNLQRFGLDAPEDIFTLGFFRRNPRPFQQLAKVSIRVTSIISFRCSIPCSLPAYHVVHHANMSLASITY
jgi:hypothetical protein